MSSIWRCTASGSNDTEARIKGVYSSLLGRTVFNTVSGWNFVVNDDSGHGRERRGGGVDAVGRR